MTVSPRRVNLDAFPKFPSGNSGARSNVQDVGIDFGVDLPIYGRRILADYGSDFADFQQAARPLGGGGVDGLALHGSPHVHVIAFRKMTIVD